MELLTDLTLEKKIPIKVNEYDVYLDEIKAWAPIMNFMPVKVKYIINFLDKNYDISFSNKEDEEKLFLFLKQYNEIAKEENARTKKQIYPVAERSEENLTKKLKFVIEKDKRTDDKNNPFVFKDITYPSTASISTKIRRESSISKKKREPRAYDFLRVELEDTSSFEEEIADLDLSV